ncbi:MAG: glycoside hydrolase family 17, partial [Rhodanobacter sp. SCN 68-63]
NEVLLRGEQSPAALAGYLRQARAALPPAVPITYADVWEFWLRHAELVGSVDYITVHVLPYWEDDPVPPGRAVQHVADVYARVRAAFPGKPVMIGETGWPSAGRPRQGATASVVNEARYLREFLRYAATVQMPYNVIEAFDQGWKRAQEGTVGGYWGIFDAQAQPKFPMQGPVTEVPRWWLGWLAAALGGVLFLLVGRPRGRLAALALMLAGIASGTALAWQVRQMLYACGPLWEWLLSGAACAAALLTAIVLARALAAAMQCVDVALGRYRDFPLGLFALPAVGYALVALAGIGVAGARRREDVLLAVAIILLAALVLVQERGINPVAWLWLGLSVLLGAAVLLPPRRVAHQQHGTGQ